MKTPIALAAAAVGLLIAAAAPASAATLKECAERWNTMKEEGSTDGLTYQQFSRACMKDEAAEAAPAKKRKVAEVSDEAERDSDGAGQLKKACDGKWKAHKASTGATGWKAYFTFMSRCM